MTPRVEVFAPSMCCSAGVCGPSVDPVVLRFAADLEWLAGRGVEVSRHNLGGEPAAFAAAPAVQAALSERGTDCLPLILVDGRVVSQGTEVDQEDRIRVRHGQRRHSSALRKLRSSLATMR